MDLKKYKKLLLHPIFIAGTILLILHVFNITRYDFIADKDSYGWIFKYSSIDANSVYFYRQLFSALIFTLHYLTGLDLYHIFKYLFPLASLVTLFPLWLVARTIAEKKFQLLILLSAAISPTVIIQFEGTRPQVMAMLYLYFMIGFTLVAFKKKDPALLYGIFIPITAVSSLFHRVFVLFLVLWAIAAAYTYRSLLCHNKGKVLAGILLLYPWFDVLEAKGMLISIFKSLRAIFQNIFIHPMINLQFPMFYMNVDGKQMGWANILGVTKYYAFYIGPFLGVLIVAFLALFLRKNRDKMRDFFPLEFFLPIYLFISFFFLIAELLPRFGNLAYLPDRAWIFLGIASTFLMYVVFFHMEKDASPMKKNIIFSAFLLGFLVSSAGALYMNDRFKYIVPQYELDSFRWIKENLEPNRVIFYYGWQNVVRYHSNTPVVKIRKEMINRGNMTTLMRTLNMKDNLAVSDEELRLKIIGLKSTIAEIDEKLDSLDRIRLLGDTRKIGAQADQIYLDLRTDPAFNANNIAYIYYAKDSEKNPYRDRLWETGYSTDVPAEDLSALDEYPEFFQKVYDSGEVKIWKYLSKENK